VNNKMSTRMTRLIRILDVTVYLLVFLRYLINTLLCFCWCVWVLGCKKVLTSNMYRVERGWI
jgi:hypothetical protein